MKICCISDIHENYNIDIPDCDLLLIAGDIFASPRIKNQLFWMNKFSYFISQIEKRGIKWLMTPGNHDTIFEQNYYHLVTDNIKKNCLIDKELRHFYTDKDYIPRDIKVYGSPWQRTYFNWSFNLDERDLKHKWDMIPEDTEILLLHSPVYSILDCKLGSTTLFKRVKKLKNIKLCVSGHIHNGYGHQIINGVHFVNAALCNDNNKIVNKPILIEI